MKQLAKPDQAGLSNLIATLILIAAAIVGGAFAFTAMRDQASTMSSNPDVDVQSINITKAQDIALATATVKNTGTKPLKEITVAVADTTIGSLNSGDSDSPIAPGETYSFDNDNLNPGNFTVGEEYVVQLSATASDNSTIDKTLKVRVE